MRFQQQVVKSTQKALEDVIRAAEAVPADKADWTPGGEARSALSQMQEIAASPMWFSTIFREFKVPEFNEHARREYVRLRDANTTLEECIETARASVGEMCQAILEFPDEKLELEILVPFGGGQRMTMADAMMLPLWNLNYHHGQINYIQLILGDREMH
ncbi:MAG: DinB family protein [Fimbriimonadaceae bacterium]